MLLSNIFEGFSETLKRMFVIPDFSSGDIPDFISGSSIRNSVFVAFLLCIIFIIIGIKVKKQNIYKKPGVIGLLAEMLVSWINTMCQETMGKRWKKYAPFILTLAAFIFLSNILGIFGFVSPTANIYVTLTLGFVTAFVIQFTAIKTQGIKAYVKGFFEPIPILLPLNIISEVVTPFSLGIRLFGNMLSGGIIMSLVHFVTQDIVNELVIMVGFGFFAPWLGYTLTVIVTPVLHAIFDLFFGAIQTYVFILLSTVFIGSKMPEDETN